VWGKVLSNDFISEIKHVNFVPYNSGAKDKCCSENSCCYQRLKKYKYIIIPVGEQTLICPAYQGNASIKYWISMEDFFHVNYRTLLKLGHGERNWIMTELQVDLKNATYKNSSVY
jgi:hypothetical protein